MPVNPSELSLFKMLEEQQKINPPKPISEQTVEDLRSTTGLFLKHAGKSAPVPFENKFIEARDHYQIPIRVFNHNLSQRTPVLVFYPGCGYISDLFEANAIAVSRIAYYSGMRAIIVNFRLVPEHPLPTAIHDGYDVTKYIAKNPDEFNIDPDRILIGGLSSGAHCAAVISNLSRTDNDLNIRHQILLNGIYDLTCSSHDFDEYEKEDKICSRNGCDFIFKHYGISISDRARSLYSPYFENDLSNLPPTTIIVGEYDGLRSDSEAYYEKIKQAGNPVEKIVLPGQTHNTIMMREAMTDGEDPAKVIADIMKRY